MNNEMQPTFTLTIIVSQIDYETLRDVPSPTSIADYEYENIQLV